MKLSTWLLLVGAVLSIVSLVLPLRPVWLWLASDILGLVLVFTSIILDRWEDRLARQRMQQG